MPIEIGGVLSDILDLSEDFVKKGHEIYVAAAMGEQVDDLKSKGVLLYLDLGAVCATKKILFCRRF